ncbi:hypothetical protein C8R46DRAFT_45847 [Mycena filopes]|nr:hypothetical protein C8R46DRAFT_45847 [Mycena filopes]
MPLERVDTLVLKTAEVFDRAALQENKDVEVFKKELVDKLIDEENVFARGAQQQGFSRDATKEYVEEHEENVFAMGAQQQGFSRATTEEYVEEHEENVFAMGAQQQGFSRATTEEYVEELTMPFSHVRWDRAPAADAGEGSRKRKRGVEGLPGIQPQVSDRRITRSESARWQMGGMTHPLFALNEEYLASQGHQPRAFERNDRSIQSGGLTRTMSTRSMTMASQSKGTPVQPGAGAKPWVIKEISSGSRACWVADLVRAPETAERPSKRSRSAGQTVLKNQASGSTSVELLDCPHQGCWSQFRTEQTRKRHLRERHGSSPPVYCANITAGCRYTKAFARPSTCARHMRKSCRVERSRRLK